MQKMNNSMHFTSLTVSISKGIKQGSLNQTLERMSPFSLLKRDNQVKALTPPKQTQKKE